MLIKKILNIFGIEKGKKITNFKKILIFGCLYIFSIVIISIIIAVNKTLIEIQKFFSVPGNVAITVIGISIFIGTLLATILRIKKKSEQKRKAQYEELIRLEEEERIRKEKERESERTRLKQEKIAILKAEEEKRLKNIAYAQHFLKYISNILNDYIIIDSNIWMGNDYDNFFEVISEACYNYKRTINIHGVQFDEIVNIKKKYEFETVKSKKARCAIGRIERLQKENFLEIKPITIDAKQNAYADPVLIKCLLDQAQNGVKTTLISNDKELCIRARQLLKDESAQNWAVLDFDKLLNDCKFYIKTMRYNFDINSFSSKVASEFPN